MEALLGRMEGLLTRLEGAADSLSRGPGEGTPSAASVHYHIVSKEQMEADQKAIEEFIRRERLENPHEPLA